MKIDDYKLTLVTHKNNISFDEYLQFITICAQAGVTAVQLREKNLSFNALITLGRQLQSVLKPFNIPLIINDNIDLALELDADGIHLGQSDGSPCDARERLGPQKIIGVSIDSLQNLESANELPIDYVGIGSIFPTQTKSNVKTIWGITGLHQLAPLSKHPIIAIGGINESNASNVFQAGAHGIAVIGAIHQARDPATTIKKLLQGTNHEN